VDSTGEQPFVVKTASQAEEDGDIQRSYGHVDYEITGASADGDFLRFTAKLDAGSGKTKDCEFVLSYTDSQNRSNIIAKIQEEIKKFRAELIAIDAIGHKGNL